MFRARNAETPHMEQLPKQTGVFRSKFLTIGQVGAACTCILAFEQRTSRPPFTNVGGVLQPRPGVNIAAVHRPWTPQAPRLATSTTLQIGFSAVHRRELLIRAANHSAMSHAAAPGCSLQLSSAWIVCERAERYRCMTQHTRAAPRPTPL